MYTFNIVLTEKCNANCSHCYLGNLENRKTMSVIDIEKIINNIPYNTKKVVLTGGEILLIKDLLYHTIKLIKNKYRDIEIEIETNGKIIYESDNTYELLKELKINGVDKIRLSDDKFHKDGGININSVLSIKKYESDETPNIRFLHLDKVVPIGNGISLNKEYIEKKKCMNTPSTINNPYLFVDVNGFVYPCTWKCIPPLGNMINEDFSVIEKEMNKDFYKLILVGNIKEAMNKYCDIDYESIINEYGECGACNIIFNKNK